MWALFVMAMAGTLIFKHDFDFLLRVVMTTLVPLNKIMENYGF